MPRDPIPLRPILGVLQIGIKSQGYREPDSEEFRGSRIRQVSSLYEDYPDIGSLADDHELLEPPYMLEDPYAEAALQAPSPDYVPGPEEPEQAPPSPDYVPGPELADDEIVAGDQPYAEDASPMAHSPEISESELLGDDGDDEMDIEEDEDADMDIDEEDEDDEMEDEEAEEEHSAPAYPVVVALPATVPSAEETEPFETDESADSWDEIVETLQGAPVSTDTELGTHTGASLSRWISRDTDEI
ncbi:hypothetical protein Tco_1203081 [Tanacetum coccineum]